MANTLLSPFTKTQQPLTVAEVAKIMRFHPRTVSRLARTGQIPGAVQIAGKRGGWRFKRKAFETWWQSQGN